MLATQTHSGHCAFVCEALYSARTKSCFPINLSVHNERRTHLPLRKINPGEASRLPPRT